MQLASINYLAVIVATFASMLLGIIWYTPRVFGKQWMELAGLNPKDTKEDRALPMILMLIGSLVTAYVMAHFVDYANATTLADGARTGAWIGIGFVFTASMGESIFNRRPARLLAITGGFQVVSLIVMGAILAAWR